MWAGGAPPLVPTSLHSAGEPDLGPRGAYDRVVDTRTGAAVARPHRRRYATCEEVCLGAGAERACMVYVPFERRYRGRPRCLR
jgi:micrococcal nuclease